MAEFFMGQIQMTGMNFAHKYFAFCNGQLLAINQNTALFSLLGTYYGGNGVSNFALPDLRSRTPVGYGSSVDPSWQPSPYPLGLVGGTENVTLLSSNIPPHTHQMQATSSAGTTRIPTGRLLADSAGASIYTDAAPNVPLAPTTLTPSGGTQSHDNVQPFTAITFCIALSGIYPSRN